MTARTSRRVGEKLQRGSALLAVFIVLLVLLLLGAAALKLTMKEAESVHRGVDTNVLTACAQAAEEKIWAEYALYNGNVPAVKPTVIPGPGNGVRLSLAHFDADPSPIATVSFDDKTFRPLDRNAMSGGLGDMDQTNTFRSEFGGQPYLVVAHCTDERNRQYEIELLVRFGI